MSLSDLTDAFKKSLRDQVYDKFQVTLENMQVSQELRDHRNFKSRIIWQNTKYFNNMYSLLGVGVVAQRELEVGNWQEVFPSVPAEAHLYQSSPPVLSHHQRSGIASL